MIISPAVLTDAISKDCRVAVKSNVSATEVISVTDAASQFPLRIDDACTPVSKSSMDLLNLSSFVRKDDEDGNADTVLDKDTSSLRYCLISLRSKWAFSDGFLNRCGDNVPLAMKFLSHPTFSKGTYTSSASSLGGGAL